MFKNIYTPCIAILFLVTSNLLAAEPITVSSAFQPPILLLGKPGLLNITIQGIQGNIVPSVPNVEGLTFTYLGTQNFIRSENGKISISHVFSFTVHPQKIGDFILPAFDIEIDGKKYPVSSSKLTVTEKAPNHSEDDLPFSLDLNVKNKQIYIGQMVPLDITFSIPTRNVLMHPHLNLEQVPNDYFKFSALQVEKETQSIVNGVLNKNFHILTYITPIKVGDKDLQYKIEFVIERSRSASRKNRLPSSLFDPFDSQLDSLMSSLMGSAEKVEVLSPPLNLSISPLPQNNKPDDFTGAIGQFTLENFSIIPTEAPVGDPLSLKIEIKGSGNFDRISPPTLTHNADWKTYPPKSSFKPTDQFGFSGIKTFEYVIIPQSDLITQSPDIIFNYFDPDLYQYMEITPDPIPLKITSSPTSSSNFQSPNTTLQSQINTTIPHQAGLLPIKLEITHSVKSLTPLLAKKSFILYALLIALFISILFILYKKIKSKRSKNKLYLKEINTQRAIQNNLQKAKKAYAQQDSIAFYEAATAAISEIVSLEHPKTSQALTLHDIEEHLSQMQLSEEHVTFLKHLFHAADMLKFSGTVVNHKLTPEIFQKYESLLQNIEK